VKQTRLEQKSAGAQVALLPVRLFPFQFQALLSTRASSTQSLSNEKKTNFTNHVNFVLFFSNQTSSVQKRLVVMGKTNTQPSKSTSNSPQKNSPQKSVVKKRANQRIKPSADRNATRKRKKKEAVVSDEQASEHDTPSGNSEEEEEEEEEEESTPVIKTTKKRNRSNCKHKLENIGVPKEDLCAGCAAKKMCIVAPFLTQADQWGEYYRTQAYKQFNSISLRQKHGISCNINELLDFGVADLLQWLQTEHSDWMAQAMQHLSSQQKERWGLLVPKDNVNKQPQVVVQSGERVKQKKGRVPVPSQTAVSFPPSETQETEPKTPPQTPPQESLESSESLEEVRPQVKKAVRYFSLLPITISENQ